MDTDIEQIIREYLPEVVHMSFATATNDGKPWVCEVHFAYDDNLNIYFRSKPVRRHSMLVAENPRVAGNIVKQVGLGMPCAGEVCYEGSAEMLEYGSPGFVHAAKVLDARLSFGSEKLEEAKNPEGDQLYKITVDNFALFGNFDGEGFKKYELTWDGGKK